MIFKSNTGSVEKSRQRRSRQCSVLTDYQYAPQGKKAVALLDGLFWTDQRSPTSNLFLSSVTSCYHDDSTLPYFLLERFVFSDIKL